MNRKATSLAALVAAAAVAVAPMSTAVAATSTPAASTPAVVTPAAVLKSAGAVAPASTPGVLGSFVVVTGEAVNAAPKALTAAAAAVPTVQPAAASDSPIVLPSVPQSVTDILNVAGLPIAGVYRVLQTSQGIYTIWYKMLTSVPQAIFKGEFGSVPTLFQKAFSDSLTWIATGAGPVVPKPATAAALDASATSTDSAVAAPGTILSDALNVIGIPVATAYAAGQTALSVYQNFYGLLTSVPQAIFKGKFGDVPTLVVDAIAKSITSVVDFPGAQLKAATDKVNKLIADLKPTAPTVTSADAVAAVTPASTGTEAPATKARTAAETVKSVTSEPATTPSATPTTTADKPAAVKDSVPAKETAPTEKSEKAPVEKAPAEKVEKAPVEKTDAPAADKSEKAPAEKAPVEKAPAEKAPVEKVEKAPVEKAETPATDKSDSSSSADASAGSDKDSSAK